MRLINWDISEQRAGSALDATAIFGKSIGNYEFHGAIIEKTSIEGRGTFNRLLKVQKKKKKNTKIK